MSGIYLHIPFCKKACHYCNFHFATSLHHQQRVVQAIQQEMELRRDYLGGETAQTIYFGGGTPSILPAATISGLLQALKNQFRVSAGAEITLEANPDDIEEEKLIAWKDAGINRLSIGIQSFFEEDLQWMNRAHHASQAEQCLQLATRYFDNITIDLIYGMPGLTDEKWKQNVDRALAFGIPHLSCYALTVEPSTPLDKLIRQARSPATDPEQQAAQFQLLMQWMEAAGYEHYEISNFSKPGWRSRHNSAYWQADAGAVYIGLGPSAHSFNGREREWNISNNINYAESVEQGIIPAEKEVLTAVQQLNEYIMTALRTMEGISLDRLEKKFGVAGPEFMKKTLRFRENNLLKAAGDRIVLTAEGKLLADGIAADLFF